jgi:hypothetical protein
MFVLQQTVSQLLLLLILLLLIMHLHFSIHRALHCVRPLCDSILCTASRIISKQETHKFICMDQQQQINVTNLVENNENFKFVAKLT